MSTTTNYGLTSTGFIRKDKATIVGELRSLATLLFGSDIKLDDAAPLYKLLLIMADREDQLWAMMEQYYGALSMKSAVGSQIDLYMSDVGIERKEGEKAIVTVTFTGIPGNEIPLGSIVTSNEGYSFETTEEAEFPFILEMTRGDTTSDSIPSPYSNIEEVLWISDNQDGLNPYTEGSDYNFVSVSDAIDWSPAGDEPPKDAVYYIAFGTSVDVDVVCQAIEPGEDYNIAANTLQVLGTSFSGFISCNNTLRATGGTEEESDDKAIRRLLNAPRRNWTEDKIKTVVENVNDVKSAKIIWDHGISTYFLLANNDITLPPEVAQKFTVNDVINNLSKFTVRMKRYGIPGNLTARVYRWREDYETTVDGPVIAETTINQLKVSAEEFDNIDFNLVATNVDSTHDYLFVLIAPSAADGNNFYKLRYGTCSGGGLFSSMNEVPGSCLYHKVWYKAASITSIVVPEETYTATLEDNVEDTIDRSGKAVAIQKKVKQATRVLINVYFEIELDVGYTYSKISGLLDTAIENYFDDLDIGDDVLHAEVVSTLVDVDGVRNIKNLYLNANGADYSIGEDIIIYENEIAILGSPGLVGSVIT